MARAKVIELSEQELIDIVDRYEYLSTLLNSKITPNINRLEKLEQERINIDVLVKELTSTKEFLGKLSTNLSNDAKQKIETYLNNKVVEVLKNAFENNETLESNISKIADNSLFFKTLMDNCEMAMKKCFFPLTAFLSKHPQYGGIWNMLYEEYERTKKYIFLLSEKSELMGRQPVDQLSIEMRERIVLPLLTIQQYALTKVREHEDDGNNEALKTSYEKLVMRCSFGIINSGRNSA